MKRSISTKLFGIVAVCLLMLCALSTDASAQGRGRGNRSLGDKCSKFVNCHDARDGRWDGRGPNRTTGFTNILGRRRRIRDRDSWERRHHRHNHNWRRNRDWRRRR